MAKEFPIPGAQTISQADTPIDQVVDHVVAFAKNGGRAVGELCHPHGIVVDPATNHIYIAEGSPFGDFARISIFSESGEYLDHFQDEHLSSFWGIAIHEDNVYVTDWVYNAVFHLKMEAHLRLIARQGNTGSGADQFNEPRQLSISLDGDVHIADRRNDRIQVLDGSLHQIKEVRHPSMHRPCDVKLSTDEIYVLSSEDSPCVHIFTHSGHKTRSLITRGVSMKMQVHQPLFFCIHPIFESLIIGETDNDNIKIFSNDGTHLYTLVHHELQVRAFAYSRGLAITPNRKLVVVHSNFNCCLRIYSFV